MIFKYFLSKTPKAGSSLNRYLPFLVFLVTAIIGVSMTTLVWRSEAEAERTRFELIADDAVDKLTNRLSEHLALLSMSKALFETNAGPIGRIQFSALINELLLDGVYNGIQGIGFARFSPTGKDDEASAELFRNYGQRISIRPETTISFRTPIVLLEPNDERNQEALGYDMFSEKNRRNAMMKAIETGKPQASGPVELVQEIKGEKQNGFLVYLAVNKVSEEDVSLEGMQAVSGFVYAPFRAGDLHRSVLEESEQLPVAIRTTDVTDGSSEPLFVSREFDQYDARNRFSLKRTAEIAGRVWQIEFVESPNYKFAYSGVGSFLLASLSLLFALALAASTRSQIQKMESASALVEQKNAAAGRSELMLQEMKHRIKNHISRIQAISRQTVGSSASLEEYSEAFSTRLQALANAQDVLTRSRWQRADLGELVQKELEQVFGAKMQSAGFSGPDVDLNERQAQAMSLTLHELATNALKYGGVTANESNLSVLWEFEGPAKAPVLKILWIESSPNPAVPPEKTGFGTKLIDANIRGELNGSIERSYTKTGLSVEMKFPIDPQKTDTRKRAR